MARKKAVGPKLVGEDPRRPAVTALKMIISEQEGDLRRETIISEAWRAGFLLAAGHLTERPRVAGSRDDLIVWRLSEAERVIEEGAPERAGPYLRGDCDSEFLEERRGELEVNLSRKRVAEREPPVPSAPDDGTEEG